MQDKDLSNILRLVSIWARHNGKQMIDNGNKLLEFADEVDRARGAKCKDSAENSVLKHNSSINNIFR